MTRHSSPAISAAINCERNNAITDDSSHRKTTAIIVAIIGRALLLCTVPLLFLACQSDYSYRDIVADRVDIHDVADCVFDETEEGWEQYSCVPIFSNIDPGAGAWERESIGNFDIVQREIF